jgi:nitroreductase
VTDLTFGADAPLLEVMSTMRAMRRLKPDPIPREVIEQLLQAATYGPSGGNNQSFSFVVVTNRDQVARIAPLWRRIVEWYVTTQTPPPHMSADAWQRLVAALRYQADHFEDIPVLIIACYELRSTVARMLRSLDRQWRAFAAMGPRHSLSSARNIPRLIATGEAASIYPGVQNLLLMARALGLAATMTTWHILFEQELKGILSIPRHVNTYATIPVGWPLGNFGPVTRRPITEAVHWDKW